MSETGNLQRDSVARSAQAADFQPRTTRRFRTVAFVFCGLLAIGLISAWVVYRTYVAYEPKAARHVPTDANISMRFDLTHVMFYEPFRRSIFPLVDHFAVSEGEPRRERLAKRGIRIGADVREVMVALGPTPRDWVVVVGGPLPQKGVGTTIAGVLTEEGRSLAEQAGGFVLSDSGVAFAQAEDGAVVFASDIDRLRNALPSRPPSAELALGAGGFLVDTRAASPALGLVRGSFRTGSVVMVDVRATPAAGTPVRTENALRALITQFGQLDPLFERPAEQARIEAEGTGTYAQILLPREAIERVMALIADRAPGAPSRKPMR